MSSPPYVGDDKPYYAIDDLQTHLLQSLDPVNNTPSLEWVENRFAPVQLDHCMGELGRNIHPADYMPDYAPDMAVDHNEAALRLMLNDSIADKEQALINFVQYGIDLYHMVINGQTWPAGGGYTPGKKMPLTFAAVMLNNYEMKTWIRNNVGRFNEDYATYYGEGDVALFGIEGGPVRTAADLYHYIDGGEVPGDSYQFCCLSQPYKGSALVAHLIPEMITIWNHPALFDYVDRWVTFGVWTLPDPYNRFPELHGTQPDGGYRRSRFVDAMWNAYR